MTGTIPSLRKAGLFVERRKRPLSRVGVQYRIYRPPDETIAIVYGRVELDAAAKAILAGEPLPPITRLLDPTGRNSAIVRPRCRYL